MSWLDTPKSEHIIRREHYVSGREDERESILALLQDHVCPSCEQHLEHFGFEGALGVKFPHASCEGTLADIQLIRDNSDAK